MVIRILTILLVAVATERLGAEDGTSGTSSSGTSAVSVDVPKLIKVSRFNNLTRTYTGTGNLGRGDNISVATNYGTDGTRLYSVTLTGSGVGGAFTISNGTETIPYLTRFNDATGNTGAVFVQSGVTLSGQTGANGLISDDSTNAYYRVIFTRANMQAANAGSYSGVITVVVAPE